jgi:hypothetical protein
MSDTDKSELDLPRLHHIIMHQLREARSHGNNSTITELAKPIKKELDRYITQQCNQARIEGEKVGAFMAASAILTEMSPLMVHRLENGFPSMTGEVIGNVYEAVKKEMKPYQDARKAQAKETEGRNA